MALKIPNTLSNLIFGDSQSASLVQQSLTSSVQPILNFINQYFTASTNSASPLLTLQTALTLVKQLLISSGSMSNPGMAFSQNNTLGVFYDQANLRMGLVINNTLVGFISAAGMNAQSPSSAGNAFTFYNNTGAAIGSVNNAGTFTSLSAFGVPSFVSSQGFKYPLPQFYFWGNGGTTSTSYTFMSMPVVATIGTQTASFTVGAWTAPRAGSVTAVSVYFDRSNTLAFNFRLQIAGTQTTNVLNNVTGNNYATLAKNSSGFTFSAGAVIAGLYNTPTTGTPACVIGMNIEVEMGA